MPKKKKSQAELAESAARSKNKKHQKTSSASVNKTSKDAKDSKQTEIKKQGIPIRVITSLSFLAGFILFLIMFFKTVFSFR